MHWCFWSIHVICCITLLVKPTWDAHSYFTGGSSSFVGGLTGVPAAVSHLTALNAQHGHITLKADVIFVRAEDLCVVFEPADRHGLRARDSALDLHQFALHVLDVLRGLFGEHWRIFTLWKREKKSDCEERKFVSFTQRIALKGGLSVKEERAEVRWVWPGLKYLWQWYQRNKSPSPCH